MAPKTSEVLSRSINNVVANWETVLLEVGASIAVTGALALGGMAALLPFIAKVQSAPSFVWIVAAAIVGLAAWTAVMAFPIAAGTRVYLDGERAAAAVPGRPSAAYRAFAFRPWLAAGRTAWARVFGIQVMAFFTAVFLIGVPIILLFLAARGGLGCLFVPILLPVVLIAVVMAVLWSRKAVVVAVDRGLDVEDSLRAGWSELTDRPSAHVVPALIIGLATSSAAAGFAKLDVYGFDAGSFFQSAVTAIGDCWFLAAFAALADRR